MSKGKMSKGKCFISQPMRGLTDAEIMKVRSKAETYLNREGYEVVNSFVKNGSEVEYCVNRNMTSYGVKNRPMYYMSRAIAIMSQCDTIYFVKGWEQARGCRIEFEIAKSYGMHVIFEEPFKITEQVLEFGDANTLKSAT